MIVFKEMVSRKKWVSYKKYPYPMVCENKHCPSPLKFHVTSHTRVGKPTNFLTMYCPFCGQASLTCSKCVNPNYKCECKKDAKLLLDGSKMKS